jgi:hypothetical protein
MNLTSSIESDLRSHLTLHMELLVWIERRSQLLRQEEGAGPLDEGQIRSEVLARLEGSLGRIRSHRMTWLGLSPEERAMQPEVRVLLRQNMDLILRLIVLERENEQLLLRRGLVPPKHLPSANRQRPHFVADLYRRNSGGSSV